VPPVLRTRGGSIFATVDPHLAINRELLSVMGPGLDRIIGSVELNHTSQHTVLTDQVLAQPFIHSILSANDVYTLFGQPWIAQVLAPNQLGATNANQIVTLHLPKNDLALLGDPSVIQVMPGDPAPGPPGTTFTNGFIIQVPAASIVFDADHMNIDVQVPVSQIPLGAQVLTTASQNNLTAIYGTTGQFLTNLLQSGVSQTAPTGVPTVPGLRLLGALNSNHNFPEAGRFLRLIHLAAANNLLSPDANQTNLISQGVNDFLAIIDTWNETSSAQLNGLLATHTAGQLVPTLVRGPLRGTLELSLGVIQQPNATQPDAPERIDVGFIFARNGEFGIILTARGPLSNTLPSTASQPIGAGDIQTKVSNATSLAQLQGWRVVEGVTEGAVLEGGLAATNDGGLATFAASAGYGAGFEFGLGIQFTQVIPLGNVLSRSVV